MLYQLSYSRKRTLHRYHFRGLGGRVVCGRRSKQGQEMGRDARRVVSVSDEGSRIDIGSRASRPVAENASAPGFLRMSR